MRFYVNQYVLLRSDILGNSVFSYILTFKTIEYVSIVFLIHGNSYVSIRSYVGIQYVSTRFNAENQHVLIRSYS